MRLVLKQEKVHTRGGGKRGGGRVGGRERKRNYWPDHVSPDGDRNFISLTGV